MKLKFTQLISILRKNAEHTNLPEGELFFEIIAQAIKDYNSKNSFDKRSARRFVESDYFDTVCDFAGLDPEYTREFIQKIDYDKYTEHSKNATAK